MTGLSRTHRLRNQQARTSSGKALNEIHVRTPTTLLLGVCCACSHALVGAAVAQWRWWEIVAVAWTIGAFLECGLFAVLHDVCHGAVIRRNSRALRRYVTMLLALTSANPYYYYYSVFHLRHHGLLGYVSLIVTSVNQQVHVPCAVLSQKMWAIFVRLVY